MPTAAQSACPSPDSPPRAKRKRLSAEERLAARREQYLRQERRPEGCPKGVNPHTGMPLKPGQRVPTNRDDEDAAKLCWDRDPLKELDKERAAYPRGTFPVGPQWELLPELAARWTAARWEAQLEEGAALWALHDGEFGLFLSDLLCREGLLRRGLPVPPLHEYLRESRDDWGLVARGLDQFRPGWRERYPIPGKRAFRVEEHDHE